MKPLSRISFILSMITGMFLSGNCFRTAEEHEQLQLKAQIRSRLLDLRLRNIVSRPGEFGTLDLLVELPDPLYAGLHLVVLSGGQVAVVSLGPVQDGAGVVDGVLRARLRT